MALTTYVSTYELGRVAAAAYTGKRVRISLAYINNSNVTVETTRDQFDNLKLLATGYQDFKAPLGAGAFDSADNRWELAESANANEFVTASFTSQDTNFQYDTIYVVIGDYNTVDVNTIGRTNGVVTVTTDVEHGFSAGDIVELNIAGSEFNGEFAISTTTALSFTFPQSGNDITSAITVGTATVVDEPNYLHSMIRESPAVSLPSGATITYKLQIILA